MADLDASQSCRAPVAKAESLLRGAAGAGYLWAAQQAAKAAGTDGTMPIDWIYGGLGGLLIGLAGAILLLVNGRIMGATGILGDLVDGSAGATAAEKLAFIAGLVAVPALAAPLVGRAATHATGAAPVLIAAGLAVGLGTRLANGCTSGHGVCGISRLAPRGIVATLVYVAAGMLTVLLFRHGFGLI